jgi:hypothetical protein
MFFQRIRAFGFFPGEGENGAEHTAAVQDYNCIAPFYSGPVEGAVKRFPEAFDTAGT